MNGEQLCSSWPGAPTHGIGHPFVRKSDGTTWCLPCFAWMFGRPVLQPYTRYDPLRPMQGRSKVLGMNEWPDWIDASGVIERLLDLESRVTELERHADRVPADSSAGIRSASSPGE